MTLLDLIQVNGFFKKVASTNGGEYAGPCPFCGGRDRFRVWPEEDGGRWWCRGCGKNGDAIQFLRDTQGMSYREAVEALGGRVHPKRLQGVRHNREEKPPPCLKWQGRAGTFLQRAQMALWQNAQALSFLHERGLRDDIIRAARLGWNDRDRYDDREAWGLEPVKDRRVWLPSGLVIPLHENGTILRLRIRRPAGESRYVVVSGSDMRPMTWNLNGDAVVVVESELDGLLIHQEAADLAGTVALGSAQAKPDIDTERALRRAALILASLDLDDAGGRAAWRYWVARYSQARRWPVPIGKDPSEALQKGVSIRAWVEAGLRMDNRSGYAQRPTEAMIKPFPREWFQQFDETQLERLAIVTIDGRLSDQEAITLLN